MPRPPTSSRWGGTGLLIVDDALHSHVASSPTPSVAYALSVSECSHAQAADVPALAQAHILAVADATQAQAADSVMLVTVVLVPGRSNAIGSDYTTRYLGSA